MRRVEIEFDAHDRIVGDRPFHVHRNPEGKVREWACNSPYCEDVAASTTPHPDDGGPEPIVQGREPWRGGGR